MAKRTKKKETENSVDEPQSTNSQFEFNSIEAVNFQEEDNFVEMQASGQDQEFLSEDEQSAGESEVILNKTMEEKDDEERLQSNNNSTAILGTPAPKDSNVKNKSRQSLHPDQRTFWRKQQ